MTYVILLLLLIIIMLAYMIHRQGKIENAVAMIGEKYFDLVDILKKVKEEENDN